MGKWYFLSNWNNLRTAKSILLFKKILALLEMMFELVNANFSLLEWQAVKLKWFSLLPAFCWKWHLTSQMLWKNWHITFWRPRGTGVGGVGWCHLVPQILTWFQTKKCSFPHPSSDLAFRQKSHNYLAVRAQTKIIQRHFKFAYFSFWNWNDKYVLNTL